MSDERKAKKEQAVSEKWKPEQWRRSWNCVLRYASGPTRDFCRVEHEAKADALRHCKELNKTTPNGGTKCVRSR